LHIPNPISCHHHNYPHQMASESTDNNDNAIILEYLKTDPESINILLGHVVECSNVPVANVLLKNGANANSYKLDKRFNHERPLLFIALLNNDIPMINLLLQYGSDMYATSRVGIANEISYTPIELSIKCELVDVFRVLAKKHVVNHNIDEPLIQFRGHNIMSLIMNILARYKVDETVLEMIKIALDHGANPNYKFNTTIYSVSIRGVTTSMEFAKRSGMVAVVALFENHMLDVTKGANCDQIA